MKENKPKLASWQERLTESHKTDLLEVYNSTPQIGLFLGAGVTKSSDIPLYPKLALYLCHRALDKKLLQSDTPPDAIQFLEDQVKSITDNYDETAKYLASLQISPEEIVLFLKNHLADEGKLVPLIKETLYDKIKLRKMKMVSRETWNKNTTLNSIISFCARVPDASRNSKQFRKAEINPKVGGILTTNYEAIVEGSCNGKFRKRLMKPVGRVDSREFIKGKSVIPVYHIHGYVSYVKSGKASKMLVVAEDDYFDRFYDPLSYSTYIAMYFLRRFPCLFIGASMKDRNIRRFLYHLQKERRDARAKGAKYFAILPATGTPQDRFTDAILASYSVATLWIADFEEIREILKLLYCYPSNKELDKGNWKYEEWNTVYNY